MRFRALLAVFALAALLAACGDDDGDAGEDAPDPSASPVVAAEAQLIGSWRGTLRQQGLAPFEVTVTIGSLTEPAKNTVHYTGIDCGGNWTYLGLGDASFRFRELIDRGEGGDCKGTGTVTLTPRPDGELGYRFRGGGIESRGVLRRDGDDQ